MMPDISRLYPQQAQFGLVRPDDISVGADWLAIPRSHFKEIEQFAIAAKQQFFRLLAVVDFRLKRQGLLLSRVMARIRSSAVGSAA